MAIPFLLFIIPFSSFSPFYLGVLSFSNHYVHRFILPSLCRFLVFVSSFYLLVSFVVFRVTILFNKIIATFAYLRGAPSSLTAK